MYNYYVQKRLETIILTVTLFYSMSLFYQLHVGQQADILSQIDIYAFSLIGLLVIYMYLYLRSSKLKRSLNFKKVQFSSPYRQYNQFTAYFPYAGLFIVALSQIEVSFIPFAFYFYLWLILLVISSMISIFMLSKLCHFTKE